MLVLYDNIFEAWVVVIILSVKVNHKYIKMALVHRRKLKAAKNKIAFL